MIIEKKSILYFFLFVIYRILLDFSYVCYIHPQFDYNGMHLEWNTGFYVLSWCVCVGMFPIIYMNLKKDSFVGLSIYMLTLLSFVPTTTILGLYGVDWKFFVLMVIYWALLLWLAYFIKPFKFYWPPCKQNKYIERFWLLFASLVIIYISGRYTGFRLHFNLIDVYDIRFEEREFGMPTLLAYMNGVVNTILPILFVFCLSEKKRKLAIFVAFIIFLSFSIGGHKSIIFKLFLAVLAYYFFSWKKKIVLLYGVIGIVCIAMLEPIILGTGVFNALFMFRVLLVPAKLHISFYDFFQDNELLYFREGPLRWLGLDSPYDTSVAFLVGGLESGNYEVRANNGLFTDAYMNMGDFSVLIFPFIVVLIIKTLDACSRWMSDKLLFLPVYVTISVLISTTFTTALLTSGLLLLMFFLLSMSKKTKTCV